MSPITADLYLTYLASVGVLGLGALSLAALPWSSAELQRSVCAWQHLLASLRGSARRLRGRLRSPRGRLPGASEPVTLVPEL